MTEEAAKRLANQIGLVYWQALLEDHGVDPRAFVYAEAVLSKKHSLSGWKNGYYCYNSCHYKNGYGITPGDVGAMWKAAGCRNNAKFRFQVANQLLAKRGDSLTFLRHYQEGLNWIRRYRLVLIALPYKTIAVIGRVSPEARHVLTSDTTIDSGVTKIRVRDLNWAGVRALEKLRVEGSERSILIRAALLPVTPAVALLGSQHKRGLIHPIGQDRVREFCPAYPKLSVEVAVKVALGTSPVAISQGLLSRKEAHQWLLKGGPGALYEWTIKNSVIQFLIRDLPLNDFLPRDVEVARWLLHVHARGAWSALLKIRRFPNGRTVQYLDRLDEIIPEDLDRGISTGVERAFTRAKERLAQVAIEDQRILCENPFGYLPKWIRLLNTPADLVNEGLDMNHCVGGYVSQVEKGHCLILSIISRHGRSTVEIRKGEEGWWIAQHLGYQNTPSPPRHQALLEAWLNHENHVLQKEVT